MRKKNNVVKIALIVLWAIVIFLLSNQIGDDSTEITNSLLLNFLSFIGLNESSINYIVEYIFLPFRKFAHFFEYFILGILIINLFKEYLRGKDLVFYSIFICMIYATYDEIHQLFVLGRNGSFADVLIDIVGCICGILLYKKINSIR